MVQTLLFTHSINYEVELKTMLRLIKIEYLIAKNIDIIPKRIINCKIYNALIQLPCDVIVSGSYALYIFGLIDRAPTDLDIVVSSDSLLSMKGNYLFTTHSKYNQGINESCLVGGKYLVDVFVEDTPKYTTYMGINIQDPMDILDHKSRLARIKDYDDFEHIKNKLNGNIK